MKQNNVDLKDEDGSFKGPSRLEKELFYQSLRDNPGALEAALRSRERSTTGYSEYQQSGYNSPAYEG